MRQHRTLFLSLLMAAPALMFGQTAAGTLTGVVTDPSGAVIANVTVVATHVDTGTKIIGTTTRHGNYTIPQMPVGRYEITGNAARLQDVPPGECHHRCGANSPSRHEVGSLARPRNR